MKPDPRGSIWRRWDLHLHTPASYDYKNKSVDARQLVDALVATGVSVVAVTDHHTMNVKLIREMQALGGECLTVLPGIELRSQLGGRESVHYVGIFSEDCNLEDVWTKLQSLDISPEDVRRVGDERVFVPFEDGCKKIRELGGRVTVHAGGKSNSIEVLANADVLKQEIKKQYTLRYLHALEVGKPADCEGYIATVFPEIGRSYPLILCSDNHDIRQYNPKCVMWVKADPCFAGLLQVFNPPQVLGEFSGRVYLGDLPPCVVRANENATKYITAVTFERTPSAHEDELWFSGTLSINHGLIAIIGKKGSGKSALADILALLGDSHASPNFSFLRQDRFLAPKTKLGHMFCAQVIWHSGHKVQRLLSESVAPTTLELVKYIPQNYLETICSEIKESTETGFDRELMEVIFSHVGDAERLGTETLRELIDYLTAEKEDRVGQILLELDDVNVNIATLEDQLTDEFRKTLESQLNQRLAELRAHDEAQPPEVKEPEQDPRVQQAMKAITAELNERQHKAQLLEQGLVSQRDVQRNAALQIAVASKLLARIENLERQVATFFGESAADARALGLDLTQLVALKVNRQSILDLKTKAEQRSQAARTALDPAVKDSLAAQLNAINAEIQAKRLLLDEPNRRYQRYLHQRSDWQKKRDEIEGSAENVSSVNGLRAKLAALAELPARIAELRQSRTELVRDIYDAKQQLLKDYQSLYAPVQEFISKHPVPKQHGELQFSATIAVDGFVDGLLNMIHQGRKGSFQGDREGRDRLREIVSESDFSNEAGVQAFLANVQEHLERDKRGGGDNPVRLREQLIQGKSPHDVYRFLYGLTYLKPRFELRWQGKPLDQLSPGERGSLLLIFYLLIDKRDVPLIMDQPEENLDNETIATLLVPALKYAKDRRQIVIVTHNPNLAVVCDADQIIHARLDKMGGNQVVYTTGAIENPMITKLIVDVLEGTKPAFDLRDGTYEILEHAAVKPVA